MFLPQERKDRICSSHNFRNQNSVVWLRQIKAVPNNKTTVFSKKIPLLLCYCFPSSSERKYGQMKPHISFRLASPNKDCWFFAPSLKLSTFSQRNPFFIEIFVQFLQQYPVVPSHHMFYLSNCPQFRGGSDILISLYFSLRRCNLHTAQ